MKKNAIFIIILIIIGLGILLYLYPFKNENDKKVETVKFGAILPLTGESAYWGKNIKDGVELAKEEIKRFEKTFQKVVSFSIEVPSGTFYLPFRLKCYTYTLTEVTHEQNL